MVADNFKMEQKYDLIVIGGGASGFGTVYQLLSGGFSGSIGMLEGRDRLGGRIHTIRSPFNNEKLELGANWIHGINHNPIYEILQEKKLLDGVTMDFSANFKVRKVHSGEFVDDDVVKKAVRFYLYLNELSGNEFTDLINEATINDSMGEFLQQKFTKFTETEAKCDPELRKTFEEIFKTCCNREDVINGCHSMSEMSLKYYDVYQTFTGPHLAIPRGYYSLIEILLEKIQAMCQKDSRKFEYHLNSTVTRVHWSVPGDYPVRITCANGRIYQCKHLVVTISLGCLKKLATEMFEPKLPQSKMDAIGRLGYGVTNKVFLQYSNSEPIKEAFADGSNEVYLLWGDGDEWFRKIYSITRTAKSWNTLDVWTSGLESEQGETLTPDEINKQLTEMFGKIFQNPNFPKADLVIPTRWKSDPFACGSYSFLRVGSTPGDIEELAKPLYQSADDSRVIVLFSKIKSLILFNFLFSL